MPLPGDDDRTLIVNGNDNPLRRGDVVAGRYRVGHVLGMGGMGIVYACEHVVLEQQVAIKVLRQQMLEAESIERFVNEARAAARITNDHVVKISDVATLDNGTPYMVMELLHGADLSAVLKARGPLPVADAIDHVLEALEAVAHAHALGIVHRDLKPENLFIAEVPGRGPVLKVLDFGVSKLLTARAAQAAVRLTRGMVGSPAYMSPEQVRSSKTVDARTDIWSVGVILYELLTGVLPFDSDDPAQVFAKILEEEPRPPRDLRPDLPPALEATIRRCLTKKRDERISDAHELALTLERFGGQRGASAVRQIAALTAHRPHAPPVAPSFSRPVTATVGATTMTPGTTPGTGARRWVLAGLGVVGAIVAVGLGWFHQRSAPAPSAAAEVELPLPAESPSAPSSATSPASTWEDVAPRSSPPARLISGPTQPATRRKAVPAATPAPRVSVEKPAPAVTSFDPFAGPRKP